MYCIVYSVYVLYCICKQKSTYTIAPAPAVTGTAFPCEDSDYGHCMYEQIEITILCLVTIISIIVCLCCVMFNYSLLHNLILYNHWISLQELLKIFELRLLFLRISLTSSKIIYKTSIFDNL